MDKLLGETLKSSALTLVGIPTSKFAYEIQENFYGRPNSLNHVSEFLHNPDYLTSFTYPLTLMFAMRSFL